jgi:protein SCO1/2
MRTFLLAIAGLLLLPLLARATSADDLLASRERYFTPRVGDQVPADLAFRDETGQTVHLGDYFGQGPVILVPAWYRCPMLCTLVLNDLVQGLRGVPDTAGEKFQVVVVSFDPREKPDLAAAKKRAYVEDYGRPGADKGWHFLTGEQSEIDRFLEAIGFRVVWDDRKEQYVHARGILLLTAEGRVAHYFLDGSYPPRALSLGLTKAGEGTIGSAPDRVLLMCFNYDPETGRFSARVFTLVRLGGILTVAGLGLFWLVSWRRGVRNPAR